MLKKQKVKKNNMLKLKKTTSIMIHELLLQALPNKTKMTSYSFSYISLFIVILCHTQNIPD